MAKVAILTVDKKTGNVKGQIVEGSHLAHMSKPGCYMVLGVEETHPPKKEKKEEAEANGTPE